jgi:hypothetical protein
MARDRSHAPDARLEFCLGEAEPVELRFVGAGGAVEVHVVDAHWPLPEGVPTRWGKEVRARIAWAMFRRHAPMVVGPPLLEALGSSGVTQLPVVVESGACYLAAYALTRGEPSSGTLTLRSGTVVRHDDAETSASVSFCAGPDARNATFEVGLAASQAWWVLALWRLSGAPSVHGAGGERP